MSVAPVQRSLQTPSAIQLVVGAAEGVPCIRSVGEVLQHPLPRHIIVEPLPQTGPARTSDSCDSSTISREDVTNLASSSIVRMPCLLSPPSTVRRGTREQTGSPSEVRGRSGA